ncbi:MAG: glycoside hydrolase family 27 protein [Clostridia bacterium]|nr:glycoside hydrolase family 27 protein [Clostridia bacterium]
MIYYKYQKFLNLNIRRTKMLAKTPPMGWNSWNTFARDVNEEIVLGAVDALVEKGYKDAGYEYIVIDDCWSLKERDNEGKLVADPEKFPHGMKYVADYVHSKGLKFGMYSCAGIRTCADYPGSFGHEYTDAKTFAEWGVDFLKYDYCNFPEFADTKNAYLTMSMALKASGREILFSACNWGVEEPWKWMRSVGVHMYRSTGDIFDNYKSFTDIIHSQDENFCMSAPGCFNDPDMLIVGMYGKGHVGEGHGYEGCTDTEYESHFVRWCLFSAPLMIGGDIRNMSPFCEKLMQNKALIAINQDEEARPPFKVKANNLDPMRGEIYVKHMSNNRFAIAFFNDYDKDGQMLLFLEAAGIPYHTGVTLDITDALTGEHIGVINQDFFKAEVKTHGCRIFTAELTTR